MSTRAVERTMAAQHGITYHHKGSLHGEGAVPAACREELHADRAAHGDVASVEGEARRDDTYKGRRRGKVVPKEHFKLDHSTPTPTRCMRS